jgi:hypothetical protein
MLKNWIGQRFVLGLLRGDRCECGELAPKSHEKFCAYCGKENKEFNPRMFKIECGMSLEEEIAENCIHYNHSREIAAEDEEGLRKMPFCVFCGARLYIS